MISSIVVAALHFLTLAAGFTALFVRGRELKVLSQGGVVTPEKLKALLMADNVYGVAALLWIVTGVLRAFAGLEKGSDYYLNSQFFWIKMILFLGVFLVELRPMMKFIRWRIEMKKGKPLSEANFSKLFRANFIELHLLVLIVIAATAMAHGH